MFYYNSLLVGWIEKMWRCLKNKKDWVNDKILWNVTYFLWNLDESENVIVPHNQNKWSTGRYG